MKIKTSFRTDDEKAADAQNKKLSELLLLDWSDKPIEHVERMERVNPEDARKGWKIFYESDE